MIQNNTIYKRAYNRHDSVSSDIAFFNLAPEHNYVLMNNITTGGDVFDDNAVSWTALDAGSQNGVAGPFSGNGHKIYVSAQIGRKSVERQDLAETRRQHA